MSRPRSIRLFELFFLLALLLTLVTAAMLWPDMIEQARIRAGSTQLGDGALTGIAAGGIVIGAAIMLALWYFVARRGSSVAKWLVVLFAAYSGWSSVEALRQGLSVGATGMLSLVTTALLVIAAALLFAPDARAWIAGEPEPLK